MKRDKIFQQNSVLHSFIVCLILLYTTAFFVPLYAAISPLSIQDPCASAQNIDCQAKLKMFDSIHSNLFPNEIGNQDFDFLSRNKVNENLLKSSDVSNYQLDSIVEEVNKNHIKEIRNWYYTYNAQNELVLCKRIYNTLNKEYNLTTESWTYSNEQLKRYVVEQISSYAFRSGDTLLVELYVEDYSYKNGNIVSKIKKNYEYYYSEGNIVVVTETFIYNEKNQLIKYVTSDNGYKDTSEYTYYENGDLYSDSRTYNSYCTIGRYKYEKTDSLHSTLIEYFTFPSSENNTEIEDLTKVDYHYQYYERFDSRGNRTSVERYYPYTNTSENIDYKAEFKYNGNDQLLHASYYSWETEWNSGRWLELLRIDHTYDTDGNLITKEKTIYNSGFDSWELSERKTYYYSSTKSAKTNIDNADWHKLRIYPNPAKNYLNITIPSGCQGTYSLMNYMGATIGGEKTLAKTIDINDLTNGLYFIQFKSGNQTKTLRFIKE